MSTEAKGMDVAWCSQASDWVKWKTHGPHDDFTHVIQKSLR